MDLAVGDVLLRPIGVQDALIYAALWSDPRVYPALIDDGPVPAGAVPARIARLVQAWAEGRAATWSIERDGVVIGCASLDPLDAPVTRLRCALAPKVADPGLARAVEDVVRGAAPALGVRSIG